MSGEGESQLNLPQRFEHKGKRPNARVLLIAGLAFVGLGAVTMFFFSDHGTMVFVAAFGFLYIGFWLLMKARHASAIADVTVDEHGLIFERPGQTKEVPWTDLCWAEQNQSGSTTYLMLYGQGMERIGQIPDSIDRFDALFKLVDGKFEERPIDEFADTFEKRAKGHLRWQLFFGIPLVLLGIGMIVMAQVMPQEIQRLNKDGVFGWGEVIDLYTEGASHRLKYRVYVDDQEGPIEDVEMEPDAWEALKNETANEAWPAVEVVYLADDLSISFAQGQEMPSGRYSPIAIYTKAGFAILLGLLMLWSAFASRNGREKFVQAVEQHRKKPKSADQDA